jgi:nitrite reductase/ring-hydroxylating ferredoxin subunit
MSKDEWHPVALGRDIVPGTSAGVVRDGREIAIWRDVRGTIHAWEDRCPHRGMKLSFGFVRGDHIACLYHGWEYGADGHCRKIPAHPDLTPPASICVPTYRVAEGAGLVWVADPGGDPQSDPPDGPAVPLRSLFVDASAGDVRMAIDREDSPLGGMVLDAGDLVTIDARLAELWVGVQSIGPDRSALHIVVAGTAVTETMLALSKQAEAFRRMAEGRAP